MEGMWETERSGRSGEGQIGCWRGVSEGRERGKVKRTPVRELWRRNEGRNMGTRRETGLVGSG